MSFKSPILMLQHTLVKKIVLDALRGAAAPITEQQLIYRLQKSCENDNLKPMSSWTIRRLLHELVTDGHVVREHRIAAAHRVYYYRVA